MSNKNIEDKLQDLQDYLLKLEKHLKNTYSIKKTDTKDDLIGTLFDGLIGETQENSNERLLQKENMLLKSKLADYKNIMKNANKLIKEYKLELEKLKRSK